MKVSYSHIAAQQLKRLDKVIKKRISQKMRFWSEQNDPMLYARKLVEADTYRFRVGDIRIIFERLDDEIHILTVVRRDKAYKDL